MIINFEKQGKEFILDIEDEPIINREGDKYYIKLNSLKINREEIELEGYIRGIKDYRIEYIEQPQTGKTTLCLRVFGRICKQIALMLNMNSKILNISIPEEHWKEIDSIMKTGDMLLEENKKKRNAEIEEADKKIGLDSIVKIRSTGSYTITIPGAHPNSFIVENIRNAFHKYKDAGGYDSIMLEGYLEYVDYGDLIIHYYSVPYKEIGKILKDINTYVNIETQKKADRLNEELRKEKRKIEAGIAKAKETGKMQLIEKWSEPCSDPEEECNFDMVYKYIDADGKITVERYHTY